MLINLREAFRKRWYDFTTPYFIFAVSFFVYLLTICPSVYIHDSGELVAASWCLGIAHPAGSPLYCILGKIFSMMLPFGSVILRYNLFSSLCASIALTVLYCFLRYLKLGAASTFSSVMIFGFCVVFWSQALTAEVYTLNSILLLAPLFTLAAFFNTHRIKYVYMTGFFWGLLLSNHMGLSPVSPVIWLFLAHYLFWTAKLPFRKVAFTIVVMSLFFLISFSIYAYLPIRSAADPPVDWGNPETLSNWFDHVTASRIQGRMMTLTAFEYLQRISQYMKILWDQYLFMLIFAVPGIYSAFRKIKKAFVLLLGIILLADFAFVVFMDNAPLESEAYAVPSVLVLSFMITLGMDFVISKSKWSYSAACVLLLPVFFVFWNFKTVDRTGNFIVYDSALNILKAADENAVVFNREDNKTFPLAYMSVVENRRPDLELIDRYGNIFENPYGELMFRLDEQEREERQKAVEEEISVSALRTDRKVYFTDSYLGYPVPEGIAFHPRGAVSEMVFIDNFIDTELKWNEPRREFSTESFDWMTRGIIAMNNLNIGDYYWDIGNDNKALGYYAKAGADIYNYAELHFILGQSLAGKGYPDMAEKHLLAAFNLKRSLWQAGFRLGLINAEKGFYYKAIEYFSSAIKVQKKVYYLYENLANAQSAVGLYTEALENYRKATELAPGEWSVRYNLANTLIRMDRIEDAIEELSVVYQKSGKPLSVGKLLARTYYDARKYWNSRAVCQELDEKYPGNADIKLILGDANVGMGMYRPALLFYREAVNINADMMEARYKSADVLELLGRFDEARVEWKIFISKAEENEDAGNIERGKERLLRISPLGDINE